MRSSSLLVVPCVLLALAACSAPPDPGTGTGGGGGAGGASGGGSGAGQGGGAVDAGAGFCGSCLENADCATGGVCVQVGGSDRCATTCPAAGCGTGRVCATVDALDGSRTQACVPENGACTGAGCGSCGAGQVCNYANGRCVSVGRDGGTPPPPPDAGTPLPPISGSVGASGGSVSRLFFALTGDTRPDTINDVANYPTPLVQSIYSDIQAMSPRPQFVVATGDFMFASTTSATASQQLNLYKNASAAFTGGPLFPVMGNHECDGSTKGNCAGRTTANTTAYQQVMVQPSGRTKTYYTVTFTSSQPGYPWTAKLIVISCNAWDAAQLSWLQSQLAVSTTYTFVARHESTNADATAPCIADVDPLLSAHPPNLLLVGHTHTFELFKRHSAYNPFPFDEVVVGIGGAQQQLNPGQVAVYGYATVEQVATGFKISEYSAASPGLPLFTYVSPY